MWPWLRLRLRVASPTPVFFNYAHPADEAIKVSRLFNDFALEICSPAPGRVLPFA